MGENKQVKVDNWGIFFLQRLQTFFNKTYFCDLTLQFEDNVQLKVHRLVMNACTEYFQVLEQTCEVINDSLIMPPDLQADVVVPIVNFMYTGVLEYQVNIFDRLYSTARLMNMTVLTKLLDAQKVPISPIVKPINKRTPIGPVTWNLQGKKIVPKTVDIDLPETLPGRKLPMWKRKNVKTPYRSSELVASLPDPLSVKYFRSNSDDTPKPTRFEWPDDDDTSFDSNSFDEISYTSKPLILPQREKSPKPSTSNFEELKKSTVSVKRSASPIYNDNKKVNIQDVKEYIKEQKLRSDYIDYDDSEAVDNDLQTFDNDNDSEEETKEEEQPNKSILKNDSSTPHNKRVRFSLEGKENSTKKSAAKTNAPAVDMSNHTKIITEVLKKYPHLVKKNKNIRLKILAKGTNPKQAGTPVKITKPASKVSYMVMKPEDKTGNSSNDKKDGHWSCHRCSNPNPLQFEAYHLYRKHLTEVHNEKTDSQMCNICGHVSRKQNMLLYHKYVKHNITPPPIYKFPKCKDCSYIALSPNLLNKHRISHTHQNLSCAECNTSFTTKSALISHVQLTGHSNKSQTTFNCSYCVKKFISDETLFQHIKNHHKEEAKRDNLIEEDEYKKDNEEIETLEEPEPEVVVPEKKEKIKIISDVKMTTPMKFLTATKEDSSQLVPSSEAESLSNVASGIAASLGLVNTIVVLDENQFILQSQEGNQENISTENTESYILPDIPNLVSQQQVITTDSNAIISQATINKGNITSTDELVMVLTDHDYSDASNNAVITSENSNIVVLYSHPIQSQDGQFISQPGNLMINSEMNLVQVSNDFEMNKRCEESIELIQQEINNHVDNENQEMPAEAEKSEEHVETVITYNSTLEPKVEESSITTNDVEPERMDVDVIVKPEVEVPSSETVIQSPVEIVEEVALEIQENIGDNHFEEPMEIEESIEMIKEEINKNTNEQETVDIPPEPTIEQNLQEFITTKEKQSTREIVEQSPPTEEEKTNKNVEENQDNVEENKENIEENTEHIEENKEHIEENKEHIEGNKENKEENTEIANEVVEEDEKMEVDSVKIVDNTIKSERDDTIIIDNSISENEVENITSDEIVPDSDEEKTSEELPLQNIIQQPENIEKQETETEFNLKEQLQQETTTDSLVKNEHENTDKELEPEPKDETQSQDKTETEIDKTETEIDETETEIVKTEDESLEIVEEPILRKETNEPTDVNQLNKEITNSKISNLLDDWDDGDTDSQQSDTAETKPPVAENSNAINTLINDWEDEEES